MFLFGEDKLAYCIKLLNMVPLSTVQQGAHWIGPEITGVDLITDFRAAGCRRLIFCGVEGSTNLIKEQVGSARKCQRGRSIIICFWTKLKLRRLMEAPISTPAAGQRRMSRLDDHNFSLRNSTDFQVWRLIFRYHLSTNVYKDDPNSVNVCFCQLEEWGGLRQTRK